MAREMTKNDYLTEALIGITKVAESCAKGEDDQEEFFEISDKLRSITMTLIKKLPIEDQIAFSTWLMMHTMELEEQSK